MVERLIDVDIMDAIAKYVTEASKHYHSRSDNVLRLIREENSGIDIAVVLNNFNSDMQEERLNLIRLRSKIDLRIEPHPIRAEFVKE